MKNIILFAVIFCITIGIVNQTNGKPCCFNNGIIINDDTLPTHSRTDTTHERKTKTIHQSQSSTTNTDSKTHNWHEGTINDNDSTGMTSGKIDSTQPPH